MHPALALGLVTMVALAATRLTRVTSLPPQLDLVRAAGTPLLVVGIVLGPLTGVLDGGVLRSLAPVIALAMGWLGAAFGARMPWRRLRRVPRRLWSVAGLGAVAAFASVGLTAALVLGAVPGLRAAFPGPWPNSVLVLAALAAVSAPELVTFAARRFDAAPRAARALRAAVMLETVFGVLAVTLILGGTGRFGGILGVLLGVAGGMAIGGLLAALRRLVGADDFGVLLVGTLLAGAGLGWVVGVSPFVVCAVATATAVHVLPRARELVRRLASWERPMLTVFLVLAGALLLLPSLWILPAALLLAGARIVARWAGVRYGLLALRETGHARVWGLAGAAQGAIALVLAAGVRLRDPGATADALLATVALGAACSQAVALPFLARVLQRRELTPTPAPAEVS